jgi:transposase
MANRPGETGGPVVTFLAMRVPLAVPTDRDAKPIRSFGVFTEDLRMLVAWLRPCGITTVVMESTGIYWIPLCDFTVLTVPTAVVHANSARSQKAVY